MQRAITLIRFNDSIKKTRANDAAAPPDGGDVTEIQVPLVLDTGSAKQLHALRVGYDFRRIKRVADGIDHLIAITRKFQRLRLGKNLRCVYPFLFA